LSADELAIVLLMKGLRPQEVMFVMDGMGVKGSGVVPMSRGGAVARAQEEFVESVTEDSDEVKRQPEEMVPSSLMETPVRMLTVSWEKMVARSGVML
jgi:hypothetical protein